MKKLIITANPSSKAFTHKIANNIKSILEKKWEEVEIMNLYSKQYRQDFLSYEDKLEILNLSETTKDIQAKIAYTDELIFVFPVWNWSCPAILKNFIDCNFTAGFAFKFKSWWKLIKLLKWKTFKIFATAGADAFVYESIIPIWEIWAKKMDFCGLKLTLCHIFWNIDRTNTDKDKYLKDLEELA